MRKSASRRRLLIPVVVGLALAACTASPGAAPGEQGGGAGSGATVLGNVAGPASAPNPGVPTVLASLTSAAGSIPVQVDLNDLRITGQATELTFTIRNTGADGGPRWHVAQYFDATGGFDVDGIYLLDTAHAKRYLAARTPDDSCVCSTNLVGTFIDPGHGIVLYSLFAALPPEVETVDVVVPNVGTFAGVRPGR